MPVSSYFTLFPVYCYELHSFLFTIFSMNSTTTYLTTLLSLRETTPIGAIIGTSVSSTQTLAELASFAPEVLSFNTESVERQLFALVPLLENNTPLIVLHIQAPLDQKMINFLYDFSGGQAQVELPGEIQRKTLTRGSSTIVLLLEQELYDLLPSELCPLIHTL